MDTNKNNIKVRKMRTHAEGLQPAQIKVQSVDKRPEAEVRILRTTGQ
jgi:hypothetical protein